MIQILVTNIGRDRLINAKNNGTEKIEISKVSFGSGKYAASKNATSLKEEFKVLDKLSGFKVDSSTIELNIIDSSKDEYLVSEIGFWLSDGTLFAIYASSKDFLSKTQLSQLAISLQIKFDTLNIDNISFGDINILPPSATEHVAGISAFATQNEVNTGVVQNKVINPKTLNTKLAESLKTKSNSNHNHDTSYYKKAEVNNLLKSKSATSHTHDDRYYTESEINSKLNQKSNISHNHDSSYIKRNGNEFLNGFLSGGFGASSTGGSKDWNHASNARSGNGTTLLSGKATNGFGANGYYYSFCFEYSKRDGTGNLTQMAIPYSNSSAIYIRTRYNKIWKSWSRFGSDTDHNHNTSYYTKSEVNNLINKLDVIPTGTILAFSGTKIPTGFLLANGAAISRTAYSELFAVYGTRFGKGNGSSTFNIADLRGKFIRGVGGNSAEFGASQSDAIRNITGTVLCNYISSNPNNESGALQSYVQQTSYRYAYTNGPYWGAALKFDASKIVPTANENRPINIALNYIIKY